MIIMRLRIPSYSGLILMLFIIYFTIVSLSTESIFVQIFSILVLLIFLLTCLKLFTYNIKLDDKSIKVYHQIPLLRIKIPFLGKWIEYKDIQKIEFINSQNILVISYLVKNKNIKKMYVQNILSNYYYTFLFVLDHVSEETYGSEIYNKAREYRNEFMNSNGKRYVKNGFIKEIPFYICFIVDIFLFFVAISDY